MAKTLSQPRKTVPKKKALGMDVKLIPPTVILENRSLSSVEIKRNSKGTVEFTVKVYDEDSERARIRATTTFEALDKKYKFTIA